MKDAPKTWQQWMKAERGKTGDYPDLYETAVDLREWLEDVLKQIPLCEDCEHCVGDAEGNGHCTLDTKDHCDGTMCPRSWFVFELKQKLFEKVKLK